MTWFAEVLMKSDGFGRYLGPIRSSEYLRVIGSGWDSYMVLVQPPSPFVSRQHGVFKGILHCLLVGAVAKIAVREP